MKAFMIVVALLGAVSANEELHAKWSSYKAAHGKSYEPHVEQARRQTFADNLRLIDEHNQKFERGEVSYKLGLNELSDLTAEEIRTSKFGALSKPLPAHELNATDLEMMPSAGYVDWRGRAVSPVKNQQKCASCYSFAAVAALESTLMRKGRGQMDLSEQDLVDCTYRKYLKGETNLGCQGGFVDVTLQHALSKGVAVESNYSYVSGTTRQVNACSRANRVSLHDLRLYQVEAGNEDLLASALERGPVAVYLNGANKPFCNYAEGIYDNPECSTEPNHVVLLVGYGKDPKSNKEFWIIKNSWGSSWGEQGFMRMAKGSNLCGIVSWESFLVD